MIQKILSLNIWEGHLKDRPRTLKIADLTYFEKRAPVITLLQHAVRGEFKEVDAILFKNPSLLLEKDTVTDYSGRIHDKRTVYQLALGAVDQDVIDEKGRKVVDGMKEMIEKHFSRLPMKPEEITRIMQQQYNEQFPEDHEIKEAIRVESESNALHAVLGVIREAKDDVCQKTSDLVDEIHKIIRKEKSPRAEELKRLSESVIKARGDENFESAFNELKSYLINNQLKEETFNFTVFKAIYRFRFQLEPKAKFESGKHFNHQLLDEVSRLYDANYEEFGNRWDAPKNKLCWQKVFGWVERLVPACDGQVIAQGPWSILENGEKSLRSLNYTWGGGKYFPLDSDPDWELGVNCGAAGARACGGRAVPAGRRRLGGDFKTYVEQKRSPILCGGQTINHRRLRA